jgi:hypothetical protein
MKMKEKVMESLQMKKGGQQPITHPVIIGLSQPMKDKQEFLRLAKRYL